MRSPHFQFDLISALLNQLKRKKLVKSRVYGTEARACLWKIWTSAKEKMATVPLRMYKMAIMIALLIIHLWKNKWDHLLNVVIAVALICFQMGFVNSMKGDLKDLQTDSSEEESDEEVDEWGKLAFAQFSLFHCWVNYRTPVANNNKKPEVKSKGFGLFSAFKSLVGSKKLTKEEIQPALEKMREHLIGVW